MAISISLSTIPKGNMSEHLTSIPTALRAFGHISRGSFSLHIIWCPRTICRGILTSRCIVGTLARRVLHSALRICSIGLQSRLITLMFFHCQVLSALIISLNTGQCTTNIGRHSIVHKNKKKRSNQGTLC